jgi:WD40 repeat protein
VDLHSQIKRVQRRPGLAPEHWSFDRLEMSQFSPNRIFISYSRSDGREFAEAFERRLEAEAGIKSWRDLKDVESGKILPQVLRAIERVEHVVLILSRRALESDWIRREWVHARSVGRVVSPILADPTIRRSDLPDWMKREEVYEVAEPERWEKLVAVLKGPGSVRRVPYMPGDLPDTYVPRPTEYAALKEAILSAQGGSIVGITTALVGAGGYGKTTLANALCRDPEVRFEFADGILRVAVGRERDDVIGLVVDLIEKLDPQGNRPGFQDVQTAAEHLGELIGEARLLLVVDDVWREAQLRPFLHSGPNCVRLVTTRVPGILPRSHAPVRVDVMQAQEGIALLSASLPDDAAATNLARLSKLAERLRYWAQLLAIANAWINGWLSDSGCLDEAVLEFERRLHDRGLTAFDPKDETQRNRAIRACVEASLQDEKPEDLNRFCELAILPEDEDVPLAAVGALWAETENLTKDQSVDLIRRFYARSLLQYLDLRARTCRLHDNMLFYLRQRIGSEVCRTVHAKMVNAISKACAGNWAALPSDQTYGWQHIIRHLRGAGQDQEADLLLTDYAWIKAKLYATDAQELFASYLPEPANRNARLVGRAIGLSVQALATHRREIARQIFGRLGSFSDTVLVRIANDAQDDECFVPAARWPALTAPGRERLRLFGHKRPVWTAAFSGDGRHIVTASDDHTARIWNAATGAVVVSLEGHERSVLSAAFSGDGQRIVTVSSDRTARVWDAATGDVIATLQGHESLVQSAAFSEDGQRVVTASHDCTARVWDAATGAMIAILHGHEDGVQSAAFSRIGQHAVTASHDCTARVWNAATGAVIAVLQGHERPVLSAAFSDDGQRVVTASHDRTARVWGAETGAIIAILQGHERPVLSAAFSGNGQRVVTTSHDRTARVWDAATGAIIAILQGHEDRVISAAFSADGQRVVTASHDRTARVWDAATGAVIATLPGHDGLVQSAVFSSDGQHIATASDDCTARVWDAATAIAITTVQRHEDMVMSIAFSGDGQRVVTASSDRTARVWDAATGAVIAILQGHDGLVQSAVFSSDGQRIVTASSDGTARVWDAATGAALVTLKGHEDRVMSAAFSGDGQRVVTASDDCTARVWNALTGAVIEFLLGHKDTVWSAAFSGDGERIVTASSDRTAQVWDADTGASIATLRHRGGVQSAAFSDDGERIVTASSDRTARVWDAATGAAISTLKGHRHRVMSAAFSGDGGRIVTASEDGTTRVWDAATGAAIATLRGHEGLVRGAAFLGKGQRIATASDDRTARVWDAASGMELACVALEAAVTALDVHGTTFALSDALGRLHVFAS